MFQIEFSGAQYRIPATDLASYKYTDPFMVKRRLINNERTWQEGIKIKADYHQTRYADAIAPEPLLLTQPKEIEPQVRQLTSPSRRLGLGF